MENKVWTAEFLGKVTMGEGIVVAPTKLQAFNTLKAELASQGIGKGFIIDDLHQVDMSKRQAIVLFNGDY